MSELHNIEIAKAVRMKEINIRIASILNENKLLLTTYIEKFSEHIHDLELEDN